MKFIGTSLGLLLSFNIMASDFTGNWEGRGFIGDHSPGDALEATARITIDVTNDHLYFKECMSFTSENVPQNFCIHSDYKIENENDIINDRGEKIGNIYPFKISIFESNSQVSEQISFDLKGQSKLRYIYNYQNIDGEYLHKFAELDLLE